MLLSNKLRIWLTFASIASVFAVLPAPANAGFLTILDTDAPAVASYLAATTEMPIPGLGGNPVDTLTGPDLTITLGTTMEKIVSPTWGNWASPTVPDVLSTTIFANSASFDFSANSTVTTFGFEAEPGPWELHDITADFYNGVTLLGSIKFNVDGNAGSRLFAATLDNFGADLSNTDQFTRVVISSDIHFAVGNIRYAATSTAVPEPGTLVMLFGAVAIGLPALVLRRAKQ